ncbi:hypothetical protein BSQ39_05875 [Loigolactobacillus backii]|uniref:YlbF family regulator n=1 Tax=Loigolactobacillus backii TaxID=375175 RepID=UPI000C1CB8AD|nr:YlbF family regulator [Loigolactobacillus backii]PIO83136.1 hypothetical protein BSQ39_05875 [Loigolactobacillus backii]
MNLTDKSLMDDKTRQALVRLTHLIQQEETIKNYQFVAKQVNQNKKLRKLQQQLEIAQKNIVNDAHYDKPQAAAKAKQEADQLKQELDQHPLTKAYRDALFEADETLRFITDHLQKAVSDLTEKEGH